MVLDRLERGDRVHVLACKGELESCFGNPEHLRGKCHECRRRFQRGIETIGGRVEIHRYDSGALPPIPGKPVRFGSLEELRSFKVDGVSLGMAALSSLISTLNRGHLFDPGVFRRHIDAELAGAWRASLSFARLLDRIAVDEVILFNGRFSTAVPIVAECRKRRTRYWIHDRGANKNRYQLISGEPLHNLDRVARELEGIREQVSQAEIERVGREFFRSRRGGINHSWKGYTDLQRRGSLSAAGLDRSMRIIGCFNSTIDEFAAIEGFDKPLHFYQDEIDALTSMIDWAEDVGDVQIVLRVHPNLVGRDTAQIRSLRQLSASRGKAFVLIPPESEVDSYELCEIADWVVTFGSTIGAEACHWMRPHLLLGRAHYETLDCSYVPRNHDETCELLGRSMPARSYEDSCLFGYWSMTYGNPYRTYQPETLWKGTFRGVEMPSRGFERWIVRASMILQSALSPRLWRRRLDRLFSRMH